MKREYRQLTWDPQVEDDCRQLIRLAVREDLDRAYDWTTVALVSETAQGRATIRARVPGVVAGLRGAALVLEEYDRRLECRPLVADGSRIEPGQALAELRGPARSLLTAERPLLNLLGRLSGIATLARRYVDAVAATPARVYDTRKTMPGWRRLEKYAVRCGGAYNHRLGLFDGVLIKDNHLALGAAEPGRAHYTPAEAVARARQFLANLEATYSAAEMLVEVEVETLDQLREVLRAGPDLVLLDNMPPAVLREAVEMRNVLAPAIELEASGGVHLETIGEIAQSGVERISVGALTHSAEWLDVGLDWGGEGAGA